MTCATLTDVEAVFRPLKSGPGLRPVFHRTQQRADAHLFISVLAYQAVQTLCRPMKGAGLHDSWTSARRTLSTLQRMTASFRRRPRAANGRAYAEPAPERRDSPSVCRPSAISAAAW